jgi:hypothetical protein
MFPSQACKTAMNFCALEACVVAKNYPSFHLAQDIIGILSNKH